MRVAETASLARAAEVRTFIDFAAAHFARQDDERAWTGRFGV
ncbi:hypothetical protein [Polaromonas sp.]|nr:hypothetical protein [Polaromonas sp.]MDI1274032.1 hypothetical protein [Polaromonas sp.]